ncbi:MAG TPA: hypothetical protein VM013_09090 [Dehalococcoidia bacterium]|nr:hypothetical protein [Dehalococcoidia bacterium]
MPRRLLLVFLSVALVAGCGGGASNLLANPGFENGADPWHTMDVASWSPDFDIDGDVVHGGSHSVHLHLAPPAAPSLNGVSGVVQDVEVSDLPEYVSGHYRVDNWRKETEFQYLQVVVIAFTSDPLAAGAGNIQVRYLLAGAAAEPFEIANAKFVFVDKADPGQGEWVHFAGNIREDFEQLWGAVPQGVTSVRVFFEARFDSPTEIQPQMAGDVYYDDLYLGPESKAPDG